jgi:glycosyltransferase involved in cell wall biosynthesis
VRVCLIGTLPEADREAHKGPERTTIGIAEALVRRGHDVLVVSDEGDAETVDAPARVVGEDLSPGVDRLVRFYGRVRQEIDVDAFDVVHAWRPAPDVDVFSVHSVDAAATVERRLPGSFSKRERIGAKLELLGKRYTARRADRTITTAVKNIVEATAHGIRPDRVIPVGVDESFVHPSQTGGDRGDVVCVGRLEPRKNQAFVARHTPDAYDVRLVGPDSSTAYTDRIPDLDRHWEGPASNRALLQVYREADVFVLPSVFEGFGLTSVEAMAAGTPVLVADTCGIADHVLSEPIGGVFEFGDTGSYQRQLERVIEQRELYGRNAREYVLENLTWETIAEQYEREYERVTERRATPPERKERGVEHYPQGADTPEPDR